MNALGISLRIGSVPSTRQDKEMARELADNHSLATSDVTAGKRLFPKTYWSKVQTAQQGLREFVYENSLPWGDGGQRVINAEKYLEFTRDLGRKMDAYHDMVSETLDTYDEVVSARKVGSFATVSFPSKSAMRERLQATLELEPIGQDWRTKLSDQEQKEIEANVTRTIAIRQQAATKDCFQRLHDTLRHMIERLEAHGVIQEGGKRGGHFADKMFDSAHQLVQFLKTMNLTGDEELTFQTEQLERALSGINPEVLRVDESARKAKVRKFRDILELAGKEVGA